MTDEAKYVLEYIRHHAPCTNKQITMHAHPHTRRLRRLALQELLTEGRVRRDAALWYYPVDEPARSVQLSLLSTGEVDYSSCDSSVETKDPNC